ncbi:MAG: YceD family protein [Chloroflexota bacterium]
MVINVAQLLKAAIGTTREYDIDEPARTLDEPLRSIGPVRGKVRLTRTNRGILVSARLHTGASLECSRCLEVYVEDLPIRFDEEYIPVVDVVSGLPTHIPHESYAYLINDKHELDLQPAIREYSLLALPMKPLCSSECAGLCPQCGANLNREACECVIEGRDARFAPLAALLPKVEQRANQERT